MENKKIEIKKKAEECLNCVIKPCSKKGCPLNNDIPTVIKLIKEEQYEEAFKVLTKTTVLPAICGRICPHENQCMGACVKGIKGKPVNIGELETFIGDIAIKNKYKIKKNEIQDLKNRKVAVIGGGPAGLTAAAFLAKRGAEVTIFEKYNYLGGLLVHGIPEFRLSKEIVQKSIEKILDLGIKVEYNKELGMNLSIKELKNNFNNIVLAFGGNSTFKMGIEGENLKGVYGGNELLEKEDYTIFKGKNIAIIGGGDVAMDVARTLKRAGAKSTTIIYRRSKEQMPAAPKEIEAAIEDGVEFLFQTNIVKVIGNEKDEVIKIEVIKTELVQKDGDSRLVPIDIEGSNYELEIDCVARALGSHPEEFVKRLGLQLKEKDCIKVNEYGETSDEKIYAIGNLAGNIKTVAWAAKSGRIVAEKIT